MYELCAVIVHKGSISGGHYSAYVNLTSNQNDERWQRLVKIQASTEHEHTLKLQVDSFFQSVCKQVPTNENYRHSGRIETVVTKVDSKWFYVSDNIRREASEDEVLSQKDAYILFYEAQ